LTHVHDTAEAFVEEQFAEYYATALNTLPLPSSFNAREFGFIPFKEKIMIRHKGFHTREAFQAFITSMTPSHAYYSAAYYEDPTEPMDRKGWLGADLVFDIDSDHIKTPCGRQHDYWICEDCKNATTQPPHGKCPHCGSRKIRKEFWLCETCLELAKAEVMKLLGFLLADFGFKEQDIETCFSGHRGYHVHVRGEKIRFLDQAARKEIVDYVLGTGLKIEYHGLARTYGAADWRLMGPNLSDSGWKGRIAKGVYDFLLSATPQQLEDAEGLSTSVVKKALANRDTILDVLSRRASWGMIKGVGPKTWEVLALNGVTKQASEIDPVVTMDIHRLIRIPNSLHGKTGLKVVSLPAKALEQFDPLTEAVAFSDGGVDVYVNEAHSFRLGNESFGPYRHESVTLPLAAGIYLLCKNAATLTRRV
jgi:DNA primase small subunit